MAADNIYDHLELQTIDDATCEDAGIRTRPTAKERDLQNILQSEIRRQRRIGVRVGLLCAVLVLLNIAVPLYLYQSNKVERDQLVNNYNQVQARNTNLTEDREQLQTSFNRLKTSFDQLQQTRHNSPDEQKYQLQTSFDQLQNKHNQLTQQKDQLQTSYDQLQTSFNQLQTRHNQLTQQKDQLQTSYDQLLSRHNNLTEQKGQLQDSFDQLLTRHNQLTEEKGQLQDSFDQLLTRHNQLTQQKDRLQTSFDQLLTRHNQLTQQKDQLQTSYEQVQTSFNQFQTGHNQLTQQKDQLQTSYNQLQTSLNQLQTRYNILTKQKGQLQSSSDQLQTRFDQLQTRHSNLTEERDDMTMRLCESPGWQKFDRGCYYISTWKKTWDQSRQWCRDRQSDLIVIKSKAKQDFVTSFNKRVWLGLSDRDREGFFQWVDGTPLTTPTYWLPGEPHLEANDPAKGWYPNAEVDCVEYYDGSHSSSSTKGWNDLLCSIHVDYWICERALC